MGNQEEGMSAEVSVETHGACVLDLKGKSTGGIRAHGFQHGVSLPLVQQVEVCVDSVCVCALIEQEGELLCHLEMPAAIQATQEA